MEDKIKGVKNFNISSDIPKEGELAMRHKIKPGFMNHSYGIFVAEMLNFPKGVIEDAKQKANQLEQFKDQYDQDEDENEYEDFKANEDDDIDEINNATLYDLCNGIITDDKKMKAFNKLDKAFSNLENIQNEEFSNYDLTFMTKKILFDIRKN